MISSVGQLGTGALSHSYVIPNAAMAEARVAAEFSNPTVLHHAEIGSMWTRSGQLALRPAELGFNAASVISIPLFGTPWIAHESSYTGSFGLEPPAQLVPQPSLLFSQASARRRDAGEQTVGSSPTPYMSVIWALVEAQQLPRARALMQLVPDSPEFVKLRRLLSAPVAKASHRKDFDRVSEYRWLAKNAKNYVGKWVAVSGDSLIAAADTLKKLREEIKKTTPARSPLLHFIE